MSTGPDVIGARGPEQQQQQQLASPEASGRRTGDDASTSGAVSPWAAARQAVTNMCTAAGLRLGGANPLARLSLLRDAGPNLGRVPTAAAPRVGEGARAGASSSTSSAGAAARPSSAAALLQGRLKGLSRGLRGSVQATLAVSSAEQQLTAARKNLTGVWRKDKAKSDSMEPAIKLMQLNWVLRQAINIVDTLRIDHTDADFTTVMRAGVLDIRETYSFSGAPARYRRRDLRPGGHSGVVTRPQGEAGAVAVTCTWGAPLGGVCTDTFELSEADGGRTLTVHTDMTSAEGENLRYKTIYKKAAGANRPGAG